jgi:hypothetical protein
VQQMPGRDAYLDGLLDDPPDPRNPGPPITPATPPAGYLDATVFVDARGFDAWRFATMLPAGLSAHFTPGNQAAVRANMDYSLCVGPPFPPAFHVPMHASIQGPAAPNLMGLGWISDRILSRYIPPTRIIANWRSPS